MRVRPPQTNRRRQVFFKTVTIMTIAISLYHLYSGNLLATLSMLFLSVYFQMQAKTSELEEKVDHILSSRTDTNI